jgi:hypothetical protein
VPAALTPTRMRRTVARLPLWSIRAVVGSVAAIGLACGCLASTTQASSSQSADQTAGPSTLVASFTPDRLGGKGALSLTIRYGESTVPLRRTVLRLPAGLGIEIPHLRECSIARLRARGAHGCSTQALLGHGRAVALARVGSQTLSENVSLWLFLRSLDNPQPTFEVLGQGYTPFDERVVLTGTASPDTAPYGEDLIVSSPAIPTLPLEPAASLATLSLTVGAARPRDPRTANTIVVPSSCPAGGFPFAADFTYADGTTSTATTTIPCPR